MTKNSLTTFMKKSGGAVALSTDQMVDALDQAATEARTGDSAGVQYVNFSGKLGVYRMGRDKEDIAPEQLFAFGVETIFRGWICWKRSQPIGKHKWSVYDRSAVVLEGDLEDHGPYNEKLGEGWKPTMGFWALSLDDGETQIEFSTDSVSGINAVSDLVGEIRDRMRAGDPATPLFGFDREEFTAQDQKNYKPKFVVEAWVNDDQVLAWQQGVLTKDQLLAGKKLTAAQKKKLDVAA